MLRLDSPDLPEIPAQAVDTLPGKLSAELDLTRPDGRSRMQELLAQADLLVQGYRPGALAWPIGASATVPPKTRRLRVSPGG